jgi:hypothetical protein
MSSGLILGQSNIVVRDLRAQVAELETANARWRRNVRDTHSALFAMRNDINDVISLPSIESDLLQGPENSIFCSAVAEAVVEKFTVQSARIAELKAALRSILEIPNSDAAQGIMKVLAHCALEANT